MYHIIVGEKVMYDPLVHGESALNVIYLNNFQCPDNTTSLDDCTADLAFSESCYSQQYVTRCFDGEEDICINILFPISINGPYNFNL